MSLFGWGKKAKKDDRRAKESKKASDMSPSPSQMKEDVASRHALEKMAYDGNAEALYQLGLLHETGRWDIPQSAATAFRYFQWAAEAGYSPAILKVAECCCRGIGVDMDPERAIALLQQAVKDGVEGAGEALQRALDFQSGMKYALGAQDEDGPDEEAPEIPKPSAPDPKAEGMRLLAEGIAAYDQRQYKTALNRFQAAGELGNGEALCRLGEMYYTAQTTESVKMAFQCYQKAMEAGYAPAVLKVADALMYGKGVDRDRARAVSLLRQAERDGVEGAGEALAFYDRTKNAAGAQDEPKEAAAPRPSAPDPAQERRRLVSDAVAAYKAGRYEEAFTGFHTAAVLGDGAALYALGVMCDGGEGLPAPDHARAFSCFGKAMDAGYPDAVLEVAKSYFFGRGTEQDTRRALDLLEKAAADGVKDAQALREQMVRQLEREADAKAAEEAAAREAAAKAAAEAAAREAAAKAAAEAAAREAAAAKAAEEAAAREAAAKAAQEAAAKAAEEEKSEIELARAAWDRGKYDSALWSFRSLAEEGDLEAILTLADLYDKGYNVPADPAEAFRWQVRAAGLGDVRSMLGAAGRCALGDMLTFGRNVPPRSEAVRWARIALETGKLTYEEKRAAEDLIRIAEEYTEKEKIVNAKLREIETAKKETVRAESYAEFLQRNKTLGRVDLEAAARMGELAGDMRDTAERLIALSRRAEPRGERMVRLFRLTKDRPLAGEAAARE